MYLNRLLSLMYYWMTDHYFLCIMINNFIVCDCIFPFSKKAWLSNWINLIFIRHPGAEFHRQHDDVCHGRRSYEKCVESLVLVRIQLSALNVIQQSLERKTWTHEQFYGYKMASISTLRNELTKDLIQIHVCFNCSWMFRNKYYQYFWFQYQLCWSNVYFWNSNNIIPLLNIHWTTPQYSIIEIIFFQSSVCWKCYHGCAVGLAYSNINSLTVFFSSLIRQLSVLCNEL